MTGPSDKRQGPDRRERPRGGRRTTDVAGCTPLVMVVDPDPHRRDIAEAILAKLRFAVAPIESVEKAAAVIQDLCPEIIVVAGEQEAQRIRGLALENDGAPIIAVSDETRVTDALIETVRRALRERVSQG